MQSKLVSARREYIGAGVGMRTGYARNFRLGESPAGTDAAKIPESRTRGAERRGEDAVPTSAGEAGDREPEPRGGQGARRRDADGSLDEVREPERPDRGPGAL